MEKLAFFDLVFEQYDTKVSKSYLNSESNKQRVKDKKIDNDTSVAAEFTRFFYNHGLLPLFTQESRTTPITVRLPDAESVIKSGGKANTILKEFANLMAWGQDNKNFERAIFKILHESRNWNSFLKNVEAHNIYVNYIIEPAHQHNAWNIVWYDKDKTNYAAGRAGKGN